MGNRGSAVCAAEARHEEIVARLRARYDEARELVSQPEGSAHLEWVLGPLRNRDDDGAAFETDLAELVVLWLEDLAAELNAELPPEARAGAPIRQRQLAAAGLQAATREFAAAFLGPSRGGSPS